VAHGSQHRAGYADRVRPGGTGRQLPGAAVVHVPHARLLDNFIAGILLGKLAADVIFYSLAIGAYELKQQYLPLPRPERR
jgi:hypothetical protein